MHCCLCCFCVTWQSLNFWPVFGFYGVKNVGGRPISSKLPLWNFQVVLPLSTQDMSLWKRWFWVGWNCGPVLAISGPKFTRLSIHVWEWLAMLFLNQRYVVVFRRYSQSRCEIALKIWCFGAAKFYYSLTSHCVCALLCVTWCRIQYLFYLFKH